MRAGDDDNHFSVHAIEDTVREPAEEGPPCAAMNYGISRGVDRELVERGLDGSQKLIT